MNYSQAVCCPGGCGNELLFKFCLFVLQLRDAVSGVRVIVSGPSPPEEEEDFPPPPPDISGLNIGEKLH